MKLKAIIFDVDGTLADTEEAHRRAFNEAFTELGVDWNWSRPRYAHLLSTTGGKERLAVFIASLPVSAHEKSVFMEKIAALHRAKTARYTKSVLDGLVPLRTGVRRLLDDAAAHGIRVCIATTTTFANIESLLRTNLGPDALDRFAVIGAGDQVARKKPASDIYEWVLRQLKASPHECVAIEDSQNGLRAAKGADLFTIITPSYWTMNDDFSMADLVLPSLVPRLGIREIDQHLNDSKAGV